tara:strand:+ start:1959 stop:2810 length:852 start_codon:yes stop_codon:yes gene_type:complete
VSEALKKYARQPKIYLALPSGGKFYLDDPTQKAGTGELPVMSMTARDELLLRTPDALMNGESVASVIRNCVPMISDPWDIPITDIDAILIAIRIATYGEKMEMEIDVPGLKEPEQVKTEINLPVLLDGLKAKTWNEVLTFNGLKLFTRPLKFKDQNTYEQKNFETQRFIAELRKNADNLDERRTQMADMFNNISNINIDLVSKQIAKIETPEGELITDQLEIGRWLNDLEAKEFEVIRKHLEDAKANFDLPVQKIQTPTALVEQGAPEIIEYPLIFSNTSFFA